MEPEQSSFGCAVCNPALERPIEEVIAERRAEISEVLHIVESGDGYHILQIPGPDDQPCVAWAGPFAGRTAARLFRGHLIEAAAEGNPGNACCSSGIYEHYNLVGRLLDVIEAHRGDHESLADRLAKERPWEEPTQCLGDPDPDEITF